MRLPAITVFIWLAVLGLTSLLAHVDAMPAQTAAASQAPDVEPAYVVVGRRTETRRRAYHQRIDRFYRALTEALLQAAPDLLAKLEPPPPRVYGYQVLPRLVPDRPLPPTPVKPQVVSYSWRWSETLIERQMVALDRLDAGLAQVPQSPSAGNRAAYETLVTDYRKIVDARRPIDADIDYNWLWQAAIARDRPGFDRLTTRLETTRDRLARGEPLTADVVAAMSRANPPAFMRIDRPAEHQWLVTVPLYTDITDAAFVERVRTGVEEHWHVRNGEDDFRVRLMVTVLSPEELYCGSPRGAGGLASGCAPPANESHIDLSAHAARFPKGGTVLTTGAASLRIVAGQALVLGPHDVALRVLAHELGHILGFPDAYLRGYRDLGTDGFQVMELVPDPFDIMSSPGTGAVLARHFEQLIAARDIQTLMQAGLDALNRRNDPADAVVKFQGVLERNATHYGATLQLAKALDRAGRPDEALPLWNQMREMAESARDVETLRTVRERLGDKP